jgi:hypothetical protein
VSTKSGQLHKPLKSSCTREKSSGTHRKLLLRDGKSARTGRMSTRKGSARLETALGDPLTGFFTPGRLAEGVGRAGEDRGRPRGTLDR